jgi:hypothetical protein
VRARSFAAPTTPNRDACHPHGLQIRAPAESAEDSGLYNETGANKVDPALICGRAPTLIASPLANPMSDRAAPTPATPPNTPATAPQRSTSRERIVLIALFTIMAALRLIYIFHYRIDSDEPQHLHVVWAWANGLISYRDVFDNHAPLFHILCAPVFRLLGETPMAVLWMRLALLPFNALSLWFVFRLGQALHSARVGVWAAVFAGFTPRFLFPSTEYRTDVLWTTLWFAALAVLLCKPLTVRRALGFGLLVGATAGVSMKTTLLLGTLALALAVVLASDLWFGKKIDVRGIGAKAVAALAGAAVVPGALFAFFAWQRALPQLRYCVFEHNVVPGLLEIHPIPVWGRPYYFPLAALISGACAFAILRGRGGWTKPRQAAVVLLASGFYIGALLGYWPALTAEDYIPFFPLLALCATPLVVTDRGPFAGKLAPAAIVAALEILRIVTWRPPLQNATLPDVQLVADVLALTKPSDFVMDSKGETIYRPRAWYWVMESMTDARVERGKIRDDITEQLIARRAPLAISLKMYPRSHRFVFDNYVPVRGKLRVLGRRLNPRGADNSPIEFDVQIPARYVVLGPHGPTTGELDGTPLDGPRLLEPGQHTLRPAEKSPLFVLFWADAWEKGYKPMAMKFDANAADTKR